MNRLIVRFAAAVLGLGVTLAELIGIALLAEAVPLPGTAVDDGATRVATFGRPLIVFSAGLGVAW
jgi:hypothetical protein